MKINLTNVSIKQAPAKSKPYEMRDNQLTGFLLRVQPTGKKTYYCEYKRGGRIKIGPFPALDVKLARKEAKSILADFYQGREPSTHSKTNNKVETYKEFLEFHYFDWVNSNHKRPKETKRRLNVDCGAFLNTSLDKISPQSVEKWRISKIKKGNSPHTVNRCFSYLRASLMKAVEWGFISNHPLANMKPMKAPCNSIVRYFV